LVVNLCADEWRRERKWLPLAAARHKEVMSEKAPQEKSLARNEIAQAVMRAIENLKPKLRATLVLKYLEDLSYQEISQVLGCSMGTVASRLNRGHKLLARKLGHLRPWVEGE
jgi:RNA polymerase sigma-70 factor (ECF subfamily)